MDICIKSQLFARRKVGGGQLVQRITKLSKGRELIKNIFLRVKGLKGYVERHFVSLIQLKGKSFRQ